MLIYFNFFLEVEEPFPDFSEDIFGRKYPFLSPKREDVLLVVSPDVSEQLNRNFKPSELESNIRENEGEFSYNIFFSCHSIQNPSDLLQKSSRKWWKFLISTLNVYSESTMLGIFVAEKCMIRAPWASI
jgi:hypothetical protein